MSSKVPVVSLALYWQASSIASTTDTDMSSWHSNLIQVLLPVPCTLPCPPVLSQHLAMIADDTCLTLPYNHFAVESILFCKSLFFRTLWHSPYRPEVAMESTVFVWHDMRIHMLHTFSAHIEKLRLKWEVFMLWGWNLMDWLTLPFFKSLKECIHFLLPREDIDLTTCLNQNLLRIYPLELLPSAKYFVTAVHSRVRQGWRKSVGCHNEWEKSITIIQKGALFFSCCSLKSNPVDFHFLEWGMSLNNEYFSPVPVSKSITEK